MIPRGTVFYHSRFPFKNGTHGAKYLVLLNTPVGNEPYLLVKTTSQQKNRPKTPGCIKKRNLFFIPASKTFFPLDTWVQLYEMYEVPDVGKDQSYQAKGSLDSRMMDKIIECLFLTQGDDITLHQKGLLKQPLGDGIQKLEEHFAKRRI